MSLAQRMCGWLFALVAFVKLFANQFRAVIGGGKGDKDSTGLPTSMSPTDAAKKPLYQGHSATPVSSSSTAPASSTKNNDATADWNEW